MFIREKKSKDKTKSVIQIVENHRIGKTTKQRVLRHIGTGHTPEEINELKRIAAIVKDEIENESISEKGKKARPEFAKALNGAKAITKPTMVDITKLQEKSRQI